LQGCDQVPRRNQIGLEDVVDTAEIDRLMRAQGSTLDDHRRKEYFDRVQEIAWEQEPFIYLVTKNSLSAVSKSVENAHPVVLRPQVFWNADELKLRSELAGKR
jgi:ABC-type transport system substrate-binding protein